MIQEDIKPRRAKRQRDPAAVGPGLTGASEAMLDKGRTEGEANGGSAVTKKRKRKLRQHMAGEGAQRALLAGGGAPAVAQQAEQRTTDASAAEASPRRDPPCSKQA